MKWDDELEGPHLEIAKSQARRIGVLAGPGTGKTFYGLVRRVARLLSDGVPPERILLLSFTRVAAADLRDKVASLDVKGVQAVRATTLHSYLLGLLQREAVLAITQRTPRILLAHESDLMLRDIGGNFGNIHQRRDRLHAFAAGWARRAEDHPGLAQMPADRAYEGSVLRWLRDHRAMLIGEVVPIAYQYLVQNPAADELQAFDHVIVDEYQDLNSLEQALLDTLTARDGASLCIAGDDDQSIYVMLRFANPEGILDFLARPDTEPHDIEAVKRCPRQVLAMANSLIRCAPDRNKRDLEGTSEDAGTVAIVQWADLDEEIEGVVSAIAADIAAERRDAGDILVLTHRRYIGERIREGLRERNIVAESYFTEEELRADRAQEALALLQLAVSPNDAPALRTVLGVGDSDGRTSAYQRLLDFAHGQDLSPREVLQQIAGGSKVGVSVPGLTKRYVRAQKIIEQLDLANLQDTVNRLFPEGVEQVQDLRRIATEALPEVGDAGELLGRIIAAVTQDDVPQHPDFVRIMSLHKSKGLTSPSVFVVGMVQGIVPTIHPRLQGDAVDKAVAEQRRLFYVAITRASEQITISHSLRMDLATAKALGVLVADKTVRKQDDRITCGTIASQYLAELGPEAPKPMRGLDWIGSY